MLQLTRIPDTLAGKIVPDLSMKVSSKERRDLELEYRDLDADDLFARYVGKVSYHCRTHSAVWKGSALTYGQ